ncbi:MAG: CCA tRNA nucleotidyltransferase [Synechococcaceae bacterium WB9_2_170]|nr:CCA tRNA nucleotidyltransferase [Synechococcaceae bacterium WB9_2_170]
MQIPDVPPQLLAALSQAAAGQRLALVGGVVRDVLLHRHHQDPWRGLPDLDLVVEGRAADLVERLPSALEHQLGQAVPMRQQQHGRYGTVAVELQLPAQFGGIWLLDLASARQEVYPQPAENPRVSPGTLEQDLARRDLTVNAMALMLPSDAVAKVQLLDPHGGQADLAARRLRFLHEDSLRDDPTRLLRAARYAARLGFDLAPEALEQARTTLAEWPWPWHLGDDPGEAPPALATRLRMELELLLEKEPWPQALALLQQWGGLGLLDPELQRDRGWRQRLRWARRFELPLLTVFVASAGEALLLARRLQLPHRTIRLMDRLHDLCSRLDQITDLQDAPSFWTAVLETPGTTPEAVALAVVCGQRPRRQLLQWLFHWRHVTAGLTAQQLMAEEGLRPGPDVGRRLSQLRRERLDQS